jgi:hypothetical protein
LELKGTALGTNLFKNEILANKGCPNLQYQRFRTDLASKEDSFRVKDTCGKCGRLGNWLAGVYMKYRSDLSLPTPIVFYSIKS